MGNCQATTTEAAAVVIQHPRGTVQRLYWPTTANEVMTSNPGHYVAHLTLIKQEDMNYNTKHEGGSGGGGGGAGGHFTRVKLLRPKDTLVLGQVYRLVTSQEVIKGLRARRHEKMKKRMDFVSKQMKQKQHQEMIDEHIVSDKIAQESTQGRDQHNTTQPIVRARHWRPSLQSISEGGS